MCGLPRRRLPKLPIWARTVGSGRSHGPLVKHPAGHEARADHGARVDCGHRALGIGARVKASRQYVLVHGDGTLKAPALNLRDARFSYRTFGAYTQLRRARPMIAAPLDVFRAVPAEGCRP